MSVFDDEVVFRNALKVAGVTIPEFLRGLSDATMTDHSALGSFGPIALSPANRVRVRKHFARLGVWGFRLPFLRAVVLIGAPCLMTIGAVSNKRREMRVGR